MVRIMFDNSHNEYVTARRGPIRPCQAPEPRFNWVPLISKLVEKGYEVFSLEAGPISDKVLKQCDILVLGQPESLYAHSKGYLENTTRTIKRWGFLAEQEIKSILAFVERGGGLFIIEEYDGETLFGRKRNNLNDLASHFGMKFNQDTVVGQNYMGESQNHVILTSFERPHPITDDVSRLVYIQGCSLEVEQPAKILIRTGRKDLPADKGVLATSEYGKGRVVAIGDATLFSEQGLSLKEEDIRASAERLAFNIFHWLSPANWISSFPVHNVGLESLLRSSRDEISAVRKELGTAIQKLNSIEERDAHVKKRLDALGAPKKVRLPRALILVSFEVALILLGFSLAATGTSLVLGTTVIPVLGDAVVSVLLLAIVLLIKILDVLYEK